MPTVIATHYAADAPGQVRQRQDTVVKPGRDAPRGTTRLLIVPDDTLDGEDEVYAPRVDTYATSIGTERVDFSGCDDALISLLLRAHNIDALCAGVNESERSYALNLRPLQEVR